MRGISIPNDQILERLTTHKDNPIAFISEVLALEHELPFQDKNFLEILTNFLHDNKLDIYKMALLSVRSGRDVYRITYLLTSFFPSLNNINFSSFLDFLLEFYERSKGDMANGMFFTPIQNRVSVNSKWAVELETKILERNDGRLYSYLLPIYLEFSKSNFSQGFLKLKELVSDPDPEIKSTGIRGLGLLSEIPENSKQEIFEIVISNISSANNIISGNSSFAFARLATENEALDNKRIEFSKNGSPELKYELLKQVQYKQGVITKNDLVVVKNCCSQSLKYKGILDSLDSIIYFLIQKGNITEAQDIYSTWISSNSKKEVLNNDLTVVFKSSSYELIKNKELLENVVTDWLNSDDFCYHHTISKIISFSVIHGAKTFSLKVDVVEKLSSEDLVYVVRKILGYIIDFDASFSLIISILDAREISDGSAGLVHSVLVEHLGYNYLQRSIEQIKIVLNTSTNSDKKNIVLQKSLEQLTKVQELLKSLPHSIELMPKLDHQIQLNKIQQKKMSEAFKESQKESVLANFVSRVYIQNGLSSFSFINGEYREPSKMTSFSNSIEIPKRDALDEVGAIFDRIGFRNAKRGEK